MAADTSQWREKLPPLLTGYATVAVVLIVHFVLAMTSVRHKSNTFDEIAHVTAGVSYWRDNDYRLQPENGNLPQRWVALPLLTMDLEFPRDPDLWATSDVWQIGDRFFFGSGNDLDTMLLLARAMTALLSVGLGLLVYAWSRRLFGPGGGMISVLVYALSPTLLAHGRLATSDLAATAFFVCSAGCLWRLYHRLTPATFVLCGLALSGLFLSKTSAGLIVPVGLLLLGLRLIGKRPLTIACRKVRHVQRRIAQAGVLAGVLVAQALLVVVVIWAFYGFRYSAFRPPIAEHFYRPWTEILTDTGAVGEVIQFARERRLLPEAYLYGTVYVYKSAQERSAFLNGEYSLTGWPHFFPYAFAVKTPLPIFALLLLAGAGALRNWRARRTDPDRSVARPARRAFYETAPFWILLAVYWILAVHTKLNIGHRHILVTYPIAFILAGAGVYWFRRAGRIRWAAFAVVPVCLLALAVDCAAIYPHYLAYFNPIAGGPRNGHKHLVDSSLDWGQDLPGLKRWLDRRGIGAPGGPRAFLYYFGTASPAYYGVPAAHVPAWTERQVIPLTEGVYCISATVLQRVCTLVGKWCPYYEEKYQQKLPRMKPLVEADDATRAAILRPMGDLFWEHQFSIFEELQLGRLCAYLRQREPDDTIGYSILIYKLTAENIEQALYGPPPELLSDAEGVGVTP